MSENLSKLPINVNALITGINPAGDRKIKQRLRDMGVVKGGEIFIAKIAPLGDPIEVILKNYSLTLRKKEAELISVQIIKDE